MKKWLTALILIVFFGSQGVLTAATPVSEAIALDKIRDIEDHRIPDRFLLEALNHPSTKVRRAAVFAAGRIGEPIYLDELSRFLHRKDATFRRFAFFSIGQIGGDLALKILSQQILLEKKPDVRQAIYLAMGRVGNEKSIDFFCSSLGQESEASSLSGAAQGLGILWTGDSAKWAVPPGCLNRLASLAKGIDPVSVSAAFALARFKGNSSAIPTKEVLEALVKTKSEPARALLCRALGKIKNPDVASLLILQLSNPMPGVRAEAAKSLAAQETSPALLAALERTLNDSHSSVVIYSLDSVGSFGKSASKLSQTIERLSNESPSTWIRGTALKNLARIDGEKALSIANEILKTSYGSRHRYAMQALVQLDDKDKIEQLEAQILSKDLRSVQAATEALTLVPSLKIPTKIRQALKKALSMGDVAVTDHIAELVKQNKWFDFAEPLQFVFDKFKTPDQVEGKMAIFNALAVVGLRSQGEWIKKSLKDPERLVAISAAAALKALTGVDESGKIPLNSKIEAVTPSARDLQDALRKKVILKTTHGEIHLKMRDDAPMVVYNFIQLAKRRFYDGKSFHRIVPNFVVQGGDPRGDGYGGPGYLIRDAVSPTPHSRGTVGIATAGKDTGGCQFFINLAPNLHLDGRYTLFAEVTQGMEVADRLEVGDEIKSVIIR